MKLLPIVAAFEQVAGIRPHPTSCWRWATQGTGGVTLRTWVVGGRRRMTTVEAVEEFIEARTAAATPGEGVSRVREQLNRELGR